MKIIINNLSDVKRVGPKTLKYLNENNIYTINDFLHFETKILNQSYESFIKNFPGLKSENFKDKLKKIKNLKDQIIEENI